MRGWLFVLVCLAAPARADGVLVADRARMHALVADESTLYWQEHGDFGIQVLALAKSGGAPRLLGWTRASIVGLAVDREHVYALHGGQGHGLAALPKSGGPPRRIGRVLAEPPFAADDHDLFWIWNGALMRRREPDGSPTRLAPVHDTPLGPALAPDRIYWIERAVDESQRAYRPGVLRSVARRGGDVVTLASGLVVDDRRPLAADESGVYVAELAHADPPGLPELPQTRGPVRPGRIRRWSPQRGPEDVATIGDLAVHLLTLDRGWLYFADARGLCRVPTAGGAPARIAEAAPSSLVTGLVVDESGVYWIEERYDGRSTLRALRDPPRP